MVSPNNEVTNDGTFIYQFDAAGNRTLRTRISTAYATDYKVEYVWDYRNRLTDVENFDNNGVLTQHVHYVYDVFDHLIERDLDPNGSGTYTQIVHNIWDVTAPPSVGSVDQPPSAPGNIVLQTNGQQQLTARYLNGPNTSAYDQFFTTLAEEDVTSPNSTGAVSFYLLDMEATLRDLVNASGTLIDHRSYSVFGQLASDSNPSVVPLGGFGAGVYDPATGLVYNVHRWYDPLATVWISVDPTGFRAGDLNLYRRVNNEPANSNDPTGLATLTRSDVRAARKELKEAGLSDDEVELRIKMLENAYRGKVRFGDKRNPDFWEENDDENYVPKGDATDAINDLWQSRGNRIQCYKYSSLIIIKAKIDLASDDEKKELNGLMNGKEIPNGLKNGGEGILFEDESRLSGAGFEADDLLPGDQIWFENPHYAKLNKDERKLSRYSGEQGSNVFYIGSGKVIAIYPDRNGNHRVYTIEQKQTNMLAYKCVKDKAPNAVSEDFQIRRVRRPILTSAGGDDD